jgi:hypothetical protein
MITLKKHKDNVEICKLKTGRKTVPVYWHPVRDPALRLAVTDVSSFNNEEFRDRFRISKGQAEEIIIHLKNDTAPEGGLQSRFFKAKKHIEHSLYTQMDLLDNSKQELVIGFPEKSKGNIWGECAMVCGASSSGKTWTCIEKALNNLSGPEKDRRQFVVISNEWNKDSTLGKLKAEKYRKYVTGLDISEQSLRNSMHTSAQQFFDEEVKPLLEFAEPGQILIIDDAMDGCCPNQMRTMINRMCRCSRHDKVGLMFILHKIASGTWSSTASSNCKWFILFPRSQRGKVRDWLNKELGCTLSEAREFVHDFAQSGRAMHVRLFSPQCLINKKRLQLL